MSKQTTMFNIKWGIQMKQILVFTLSMLVTCIANANCYGTGAYRTCTDTSSGNTYNVQRYGNTTNVQGFNSQTGSQWTQNSQTLGNTTYIQGNTNGNNWNQTITTMPGMTIQSGTDSRGNSFNKTCTVWGCN
jgi:hypothetical protein